MLTVDECVRKAWACLIAGDSDGRHEWLRKAEHIMKQSIRMREGGPLQPGEPIQLVKGADGVYAPKAAGK